MNLKELVNKIHTNAMEKGFWDNPRETGTLLALIHSEVSEALEADRNKDKGEYIELKLNPQFFQTILQGLAECGWTAARNELIRKAKRVNPEENFKEELADTVIRILDLCGGMNIDIEEAINKKIAVNAGREKMHGKRY